MRSDSLNRGVSPWKWLSVGGMRDWIILGALLLFFGVFLIWPIAQVVKTGFTDKQSGFTLAYIQLIFQDPVLVKGLLNSALISGCVTLLTLLLALPLAILMVRYDFPGRALFSGLLLVPLILPPFVGAMGMRLVLGRFGPLTQVVAPFGSFFGHPGLEDTGIDWLGSLKLVGVILVEALNLYPIMLLNVQAAMANIDPAMEQAAENLGAGRWTTLRRITLPLTRPGIFAGATLVMIWSFTELGTPLMFDMYTVTPVQVFKQITDVADNPLPYAMVVVMLMGSVGLYLVGKTILGRGFEASTTKAATVAVARKLTGWKAWVAVAACLGVILMALMPHTAVILTSLTKTGAWYRSILPQELTFAHYSNALSDDMALPSVGRSIQYALIATVVALGVGLAAGVLIVRSRNRFRGVVDLLAMMPLAVPGLVIAFGYLAISVALKNRYPVAVGSDSGWLNFLNVQEYPVVFLVIAYATRRVPYVVRACVAGLQQTPKDLELAAENLGASKATVLRRITVPLIAANLVAGALLAFAFAMLEVSDSLILAQRSQYYPITKAIWDISQRLGDGIYMASSLGVWAMIILTLTLLGASSFLGRKMGAIFRV